MSLPGMRLEPGPKRNERVAWWNPGYRNGPLDLDSMIQLSWIYTWTLNRKSDALGLAQRAADLLPPEKDALVGTFTLYNLAVIKARTDDATGAIDILRRLLGYAGRPRGVHREFEK